MTKIHILPRKKGWAVKKEGTERASRVFTSKRTAIAWANNHADDAYIFVHDITGKIQRLEGRSYSEIPEDSMKGRRVHVVPSDSDWAVKKANAQKPSKVFGSKYGAIRYAHQMADRNNSTMIVHTSTGEIDHVDIPPHFTSPASALLHI